MSKRFVIKYCNILDSVFLIDTLGRMPLTQVHSELSVHGLDCNDRERAEERQAYYEGLFGFQRSLIQNVTSFELQTRKWESSDFYSFYYSIFDNNGRHVIRSHDLRLAVEFKEWLEMELQHG